MLKAGEVVAPASPACSFLVFRITGFNPVIRIPPIRMSIASHSLQLFGIE